MDTKQNGQNLKDHKLKRSQNRKATNRNGYISTLPVLYWYTFIDLYIYKYDGPSPFVSSLDLLVTSWTIWLSFLSIQCNLPTICRYYFHTYFLVRKASIVSLDIIKLNQQWFIWWRGVQQLTNHYLAAEFADSYLHHSASVNSQHIIITSSLLQCPAFLTSSPEHKCWFVKI